MRLKEIEKLILEFNSNNKNEQDVAYDKYTTSDEISIRELLSDEHKAIASYEKLALETGDSRVAKVFLEIASEEKVHVAELEALLKEIGMSPSKEIVAKGESEVRDLLATEEHN